MGQHTRQAAHQVSDQPVGLLQRASPAAAAAAAAQALAVAIIATTLRIIIAGEAEDLTAAAALAPLQ